MNIQEVINILRIRPDTHFRSNIVFNNYFLRPSYFGLDAFEDLLNTAYAPDTRQLALTTDDWEVVGFRHDPWSQVR